MWCELILYPTTTATGTHDSTLSGRTAGRRALMKDTERPVERSKGCGAQAMNRDSETFTVSKLAHIVGPCRQLARARKQSTVLYILTYTARPGTSAGRQPAQPLLGSSPHTLGRRTGRLRTDGTPRRMGVLGAQQGRDHLGTGRGYGVVLRPLRL